MEMLMTTPFGPVCLEEKRGASQWDPDTWRSLLSLSLFAGGRRGSRMAPSQWKRGRILFPSIL